MRCITIQNIEVYNSLNEEELSYDNHDEIVTRTAKISYDYMYYDRARVK